jgi:hypothetical protein
MKAIFITNFFMCSSFRFLIDQFLFGEKIEEIFMNLDWVDD